MKEIIVVAFDPSITRTGYAALRKVEGCPDPEPIEFGAITPTKKRNRKAIPSTERIEQLVAEIRAVVARFDGANFVVEITSGKTSKRHKGRGAGLGTYGMAVGRVVGELLATQPHVRQIYENEWTRGFSKGDRKRTAALAYPAYGEIEQERDPEGDISDALMLAEWELRNNPNLHESARIIERITLHDPVTCIIPPVGDDPAQDSAPA